MINEYCHEKMTKDYDYDQKLLKFRSFDKNCELLKTHSYHIQYFLILFKSIHATFEP